MVFENLMALLIAVENQCPQEVAFKMLDRYMEGKKVTKKPSFPWTFNDVQDITRLYAAGVKQGEIGSYYGVKGDNISKLIRGVRKPYENKKSCLSSQHN
jgi:hypothetical protein